MEDRIENVFCRDDLVFAKVRGYPPWPAKIEGLASKTSKEVRYLVLFYGTFERGTCNESKLFHFEEHKEKYGQSKRKGFEEAMLQIEEEAASLKGETSCDLVKEKENVSACLTDPLSERLPTVLSTQSSSNEGSRPCSIESCRPLLKEEPEIKSIKSTHRNARDMFSHEVDSNLDTSGMSGMISMNEPNFVVKEESIPSEEFWLDELKVNPASPLIMDIQIQESEEADELDEIKETACDLVKEKENASACLTDPLSERLPTVLSTKSSSNEGSRPCSIESCKPSVKEEAEIKSIKSTHSNAHDGFSYEVDSNLDTSGMSEKISMNEPNFVVKEESIPSEEFWLDELKVNPASPLIMDIQIQESEEADELDEIKETSCDLVKEKENASACLTDPLSERLPTVLSPQSSSNEGSGPCITESCKPSVKEEAEIKSIKSTHSNARDGFSYEVDSNLDTSGMSEMISMNEPNFVVKEESIPSEEFWLDELKVNPASPLIMDIGIQESEETDELDEIKVEIVNREQSDASAELIQTYSPKTAEPKEESVSSEELIENCSSETKEFDIVEEVRDQINTSEVWFPTEEESDVCFLRTAPESEAPSDAEEEIDVVSLSQTPGALPTNTSGWDCQQLLSHMMPNTMGSVAPASMHSVTAKEQPQSSQSVSVLPQSAWHVPSGSGQRVWQAASDAVSIPQAAPHGERILTTLLQGVRPQYETAYLAAQQHGEPAVRQRKESHKGPMQVAADSCEPESRSQNHQPVQYLKVAPFALLREGDSPSQREGNRQVANVPVSQVPPDCHWQDTPTDSEDEVVVLSPSQSPGAVPTNPDCQQPRSRRAFDMMRHTTGSATTTTTTNADPASPTATHHGAAKGQPLTDQPARVPPLTISLVPHGEGWRVRQAAARRPHKDSEPAGAALLHCKQPQPEGALPAAQQHGVSPLKRHKKSRGVPAQVAAPTRGPEARSHVHQSVRYRGWNSLTPTDSEEEVVVVFVSPRTPDTNPRPCSRQQLQSPRAPAPVTRGTGHSKRCKHSKRRLKQSQDSTQRDARREHRHRLHHYGWVEPDEMERRVQHNKMERERRNCLHKLMKDLRKCLPTLKDHRHVPKVNILSEASKYCHALSFKEERLSHKVKTLKEHQAFLMGVLSNMRRQIAALRFAAH